MGRLQFYGPPAYPNPNIDQLAKESATYTRGYVTSPLCGPSLASIITGNMLFNTDKQVMMLETQIGMLVDG